jgi:hypothetical protein
MPIANAHPKKRFFIEMFTRDIPLVDCVLDLIDNCFDGLARAGKLDLHTVSNDIFGKKRTVHAPRKQDRPYVRVTFSRSQFQIKDNCGGIDFTDALEDVFNFGHNAQRSTEYLGVYGVGMKRALFKMGDYFTVTSKTSTNGFRCELDVPNWMDKDSTMDDWTIPLTKIKAAESSKRAGTTITVSDIKNDVADRLGSPAFQKDLLRVVGRVYAFLVDKHVQISINGTAVRPFSIPVGQPQKGKTANEQFKHDGVKVRVLATLASQAAGRPTKENSGWYVVCNGRVVLVADTSEVTGWGIKPTPLWVPKYTSFIGFVFFESTNPLALPWTTTKRGVNREAAVYRKALCRMAVLARPILSFCNRKYGPDADDGPVEREIAQQVTPTTIARLARRAGAFEIAAQSHGTKKTTVRVQYGARIVDIEKIRKHLRAPRMGASKIGEHTLDYFLRQEGLK